MYLIKIALKHPLKHLKIINHFFSFPFLFKMGKKQVRMKRKREETNFEVVKSDVSGHNPKKMKEEDNVN